MVNFLAEETLAVVVLTTSPIACVGTDKKTRGGQCNKLLRFDGCQAVAVLVAFHFTAIIFKDRPTRLHHAHQSM